MSDFSTDPNRSIEEILKDIEVGAYNTSQHTANFLGAVLAPFAGLLVKLSRNAEANAQKLEAYTRRLYWLTVVITVLTLIVALLTVGLVAKGFTE